LHELSVGQGYFVRLTSQTSANAFVQGTRVPITTPIPLEAGWNWIGYLPEATLPITVALQSIEGHYQLVQSLDKTYDPALPAFSTLWTMEPGQGYMLYATDAVTLTYPATDTTGMMTHSSIETLFESAAGECSVGATPAWDVIYGSVDINGDPAPAGTRIEALTPRGEVAGCYIVEESGKLRMTHIYGAEGLGRSFGPGFRAGEPLSFRVDGLPAWASAGIAWRRAPHPQEIELQTTVHWVYLPMVIRTR
jgi:hypothetical protein